MILKRYGTAYHSVDPNFDSKALNEIGFRRNRSTQVPAEELEAGWERIEEHLLSAEAEGEVQDHTEQALLHDLEEQLAALVAGLADDEVLVFENEDGHDYPKTRQKTRNVVDDGETRLHFSYSVRPPLRFGRFRRKA